MLIRGPVVLGGAIAAVLCVPLGIAIDADATATEVLLSQGYATVASSAVSAASLATDNDLTTSWVSKPGPGTQWLRVDLGGILQVQRVRLDWGNAYAKSYRVQASADGANWRDLYATRAGKGGIEDLSGLAGTGRYVRVLATQRATDAGYALRDFRVYGPPGAKPVLERATVADPGLLAAGLENPQKKEMAMELVASAENSTLNWRQEYGYIEDLGDGRGYTGGIIGFCSGTDDMLAVVEAYTKNKPGNVLARYLPALRAVDGSDSHAGLDPGFPAAWKAAAADPVFQKAQEDERDTQYLAPAVSLARTDGLRGLGQFAYYDAAVMHGLDGLRSIRAAAMRRAATPARGGDEIAYLSAFLDARVAEMRTEADHDDTTRVDTAQRVFLKASNLDLTGPIKWKVYGDPYSLP